MELNNRKVRYGNVRVFSSASPEGPSALNEILARNRAKVLLDYMRSHVEWSGVEFEMTPVELDWSLFKQLVNSSDLPEKKQVLEILEKEPESDRKRLLKSLKGGRVWNEMLRSLYSDMRTCVLYVHYIPQGDSLSFDWVKPDISLALDSLVMPVRDLKSREKRHFSYGCKDQLTV